MIQDKDAIDALNRTDKKAEGVGSKLLGMGSSAVKGAAVMGGAVAAGGTALLGMANKAAGTGDRIDKMSQKIGMSAQGFQEWEYILSQNGTSIEVMEAGMKKLTNVIDQAAEGTGKGADIMAKLGVSVTDSSGAIKDQETIFNEAVVALQAMEDGTEKAKLANDLFGGSGKELMPLLNGTTEGMEELRQSAHDMGIVLSEEAVSSSAGFTDTMDNVQRSLGAVTAKVGVALMPVIQTFLDWVMEHMPEIQAVMSAVFGAIEWVVQTVVDVFNTYFLPTIQKIVGWVQEHWPTIQEVIAKVFDTIKQVWEETLKPVFEAVMGLLKTVWDLFQTAWPVIQRIVKVAFDLIKTYYNSILKPVFEFITKLINKLKEKFDEHMPKIEKVFKAMADTIEWAWEKIIKPAVEAIGDVLSWLFDAFEEYIWPLVSLVIDWFAEMTDGMSEKIEWVRDKIDLAIQKITGFFDGIKEMKDNVLGWFTDIKDGIAEKINNAKEAVGDAIDKIKGFFDFNFEWPKLKMPKFSIEGTMNPLKWLKEGVPKLKVNWNAAGAIFDRPTIFSTPYGLQGVGEAGPEAVAPIGKLQSYIAEAVAEARGNQGMNIVVNVDRMDSTTDIDELMEYMGNRMKEKAYSLGLV